MRIQLKGMGSLYASNTFYSLPFHTIPETENGHEKESLLAHVDHSDLLFVQIHCAHNSHACPLF
jgi:hypothetical protein